MLSQEENKAMANTIRVVVVIVFIFVSIFLLILPILITFSIRNVGDYEVRTFRLSTNFDTSKSLYFIAVSPIFYIHC